MPKILVTGSCGYIGSHTLLDLLENGIDVVSVDNLSRSTAAPLAAIEGYIQKKIAHYTVDLKNAEALKNIFDKEQNIDAIIHFAAYKAVGESVEQPLAYYENNLLGLLNLLKIAPLYAVQKMVFSSSCTVYGNAEQMPVTEKTPLAPAASPYGATKQIGENIIMDFCKANPFFKAVLLRYFNPAGAHPANIIGEMPFGKPANLLPGITQSAIGKIPPLHVFGTDYNTRDGSCIRDYIHVSDIAAAHSLAVQRMHHAESEPIEIYNLGTGQGTTVLEAIAAFEHVANQKLNYVLAPRRAGDIGAIYADNRLAKQTLGWKIKYDMADIMRTAWAWEQRLHG